MRNAVDHLKDQDRERHTPRPERCEAANIWIQSVSSEGLSMEWVFDQYAQARAEIRGRS
jgi:hypothetical protein